MRKLWKNEIRWFIAGKLSEPSRAEGSGIDIHAAIGKFPKPKKGWTLPGHNYTGPYNPLEKQVKFNPETGEILEIYQQPTGATDAIAMQHDVDYDVCSNREKNAKTKQIKKWLSLLTQFLTNRDSGVMRLQEMQSMLNKS